ncbi:sensor histidine kinase [Streptosporangium sp. NPDC004379]|uniref:sensor histidine kinase n=1 Tax=Streptosporangium sp. NPDC004379 TaxID=3366189 RepID=UPI003698E933
MNPRERAGAVAALAMLAGGAGGSPFFGPLVVLPPAAALAAVMWALGVAGDRSRGRFRVPAVSCAAAALSLGATGAALAGSPIADGRAAGVGALVESGALLVLIGVVVRRAPTRPAAVSALLAGLAVAVWLFRFLVPSSPLEVVGVMGFWAACSAAAAGVGLYLRSMDRRRVRAIHRARRAQRLGLARDLHDFVAHDISEMIAQAQAGQVVGPADPGRALTALRDIERAGLRAMEAMDRTVHMLREHETENEHESGDGNGGGNEGGGGDGGRAGRGGDDGRDRGTAPVPTLADLPDLVTRFSAPGPPAAHLDVRGLDLRRDGDGPGARPSREIGATAYRVVVEALTNVRRHAPAATRVEVAVALEAGVLTVRVRDDGATGRGRPAPAGADAPGRPGPEPRDGGLRGEGGSRDGGSRGHGGFRHGGPEGLRPGGGRRGGFGLPGLTGLVEALGGTLRAGAVPGGWSLTAVLPGERGAPRVRAAPDGTPGAGRG